MNEIFKTSKGETLKSMMRRPETARLIKEALTSPLGSTSRTKAKKIFSIMSKLNSSYDGYGGPGTMYNPAIQPPMAPEMNPVHIPTDNPKGMVIFHKIPKPRIVYGNSASKYKPRAGSFDGAGGPGKFDGEGGFGDYVNNLFGGDVGKNIIESVAKMLPQSDPFSKDSVIGGAINSVGGAINNAVSSAGGLLNKNKGLSDFNMRLSGYVPETGYKVGETPSYAKNTTDKYIKSPNDPNTLMMNKDYKAPATATTPALGGASSPTLGPVTGINTTAKYIKDPKNQSALIINPNYGKTATGGNVTEKKDETIVSDQNTSTEGNTSPIVPPESNTSASLMDTGTKTKYTAVDIANAIKKTETGSGVTTGQSGEVGAFQFMPDTWSQYSTEYAATHGLKSIEQTDINQEAVATWKIQQWMDQGYTPEQIAAAWNAGPEKAISGAWKTNVGDNGNVHYDTPKYVSTFLSNLNGSTTTTNGVNDAIKTGIAENKGAGMTAFDQITNKNDPITMGMTVEQKIAKQDTEARKKWSIDELEKEKNDLEMEKINLPKDMVSFIKSRDEYLVQTDKEIADFRTYMDTHMDMSNPVDAQEANQHLNYLYTLRGRQNQSYVGFINQEVDRHQRELDTVTNNYNTALKAYEREITQTAAITQGMYTMYSAALADMYTAVSDAPTKALQLQYLQKQVLAMSTQTPADIAAQGLLEQSKKLDGVIWKDGYVMPNIDLLQKVQELGASDPQISTQNIIQTYVNGVDNFLNAPVEKDEVTGTGITFSGKLSTAKWAIQQLGYLASAYSNDAVSQKGALDAQQDISDFLASTMASGLISAGKVPQMMEAVKSLGGKSWTGSYKTPPTEDSFVKTFISKTGNPEDESTARAIYTTFKRYVEDDGNKITSPTSAVQALLYPTSSTTDLANPAPLTVEEFAQRIGRQYADTLIKNSNTQQ